MLQIELNFATQPRQEKETPVTHSEECLCSWRIVGKEGGQIGLGLGIPIPVLSLTLQVPLS